MLTRDNPQLEQNAETPGLPSCTRLHVPGKHKRVVQYCLTCIRTKHKRVVQYCLTCVRTKHTRVVQYCLTCIRTKHLAHGVLKILP